MRKLKDFVFDYTIYNINLRKSLIDKIFFMDKIDAKVYVDFGCADGTLISFLGRIFPEYTFVGYDNDPEMIKLALDSDYPSNVFFTGRWKDVTKRVRAKNSVLILSSVLHEVYDNGSQEEVWDKILNKFKYIVIRDIIPSVEVYRQSVSWHIINITGGAYKVPGHMERVEEFEKIWGSLEQNHNLIHYLMKYRYIDNWENEVKENYFSVSREDVMDILKVDYDITYKAEYPLPYLVNVVKKDFGITIIDNTHFKAIFKRKPDWVERM